MSDALQEVYLSVGSNIAPEDNICRALDALRSATRLSGISLFFRTPALGRPDQHPYLNGVWRIDTSLEPRELKFKVLRPIEQQLGRVRSDDKCAPRTIDLDILLYGARIINEPDLRIPDPEIRTRPFVTMALYDLAPELVLPDTGEPLESLVSAASAEALSPRPGFTKLLKSRCAL